MLTLNKVQLAVGVLAALLLTACGGGVDSVAVSDAGSYTVESGVAQKGPLAQGSVVTVDELSSTTLQPNGKEYTFRTNNNLGTFSTSGITFGSSYLSTLASGYYFNEITGAQSNDTVVLSGLSQVGTGGDSVINVNVLSSMAVNRVTKLATTAPVKTFALARAQAQRELLAAFYIYNGTAILTGTTVNNIAQPANLTALDLSKSRAGDQMLAAMSGVVMTAGVNGNGVNTLLSQIAVDLADDGLLNNSTNYRTSVQSKLCAAAAATDFANVATNLNALYGTSYSAIDLSQWVDTSGCVDQVINKYKFTANNVAVGTLSKSPAYTVGADDDGQCFSVGGVTTGATAGLYYNGASPAVVGTQIVKAGDSVTIALSASSSGAYAGFIQRSAPVNGKCPNVAPTSGLTRLAKYVVDDAPSATYINAWDGSRVNISGIYDTGCVQTKVGSARYVLTVVPNGTDTATASLKAQLYPNSQNLIVNFSDHGVKFNTANFSYTPVAGTCGSSPIDLTIDGQIKLLTSYEAYSDWSQPSTNYYGWGNQLTFRLDKITLSKGTFAVPIPAYGATTTLGYKIFNGKLRFLYGPAYFPLPIYPNNLGQSLMIDGYPTTSIRSLEPTYLTKQ